MRTLFQLVVVCSFATLAACSIDAITFPPVTEDCVASGDEDGNGMADCSDPACLGTPACQIACGDGELETGEGCDDGNGVDGDGCDSNCTATSCGNGISTMGEACDDGNTTNGDGCEDDCSIRVTVTLQPDGTAGKDGRAFSLQPDTPAPDVSLVYAMAWTFSGVPGTVRSFLDFDIPPPPSGAMLASATLSLFADPTNGHSTLSGSNELLVRQITGPWDEATVRWNAQPSSEQLTQIVLPPSVSPSQTYNIDVTSFVRQELSAPGQFHGFMFQLQSEQYYRAVIFCSSDHIDPALRPKLVLVYSSAI